MALRRPRRRRLDPNAMTTVEHLRELRRRLIRAIVAVTIGAIAAYAVYPHLLSVLTEPLCTVEHEPHCVLYVTGPIDGFAIRLKVAAVAGLFLASPIVLWELWRFVAPGLKRGERRLTLGFLVSSVALFVAGGVVAWLVYPRALGFFQSAAGAQVHAIYTPQSYLSLLLILMIAFGVAFLFPVVLVGLELAGVVSPAALRRHRRPAWLGIIVVVAILIPSNDPYSLTAMTVPLLVFYELSIVVGSALTKRRARVADAGG
ncbi:Sec-independent protein translocase, TatC subunit [Acidimicrobium ferrooxidans DSM 10331]|uniref:Sec-independent protein translocase protein TatC n=2 Tax=Acidimicrobium ferrooxidans TaxID=53635 RepID=C7LYQ4_ACIFD|nr:Sec-independent protein translocase, TatC subunit [Acidimicrobium ferrooxidans DSM 10331]